MSTHGVARGDHVESLAEGPSAWAEDVTQLSAGPLGFRAAWADLPGVGVHVFRYGAALRLVTERIEPGLALNVVLGGDGFPMYGASEVSDCDAHLQPLGLPVDYTTPRRAVVLAVVVEPALVADLGWGDELPPLFRTDRRAVRRLAGACAVALRAGRDGGSDLDASLASRDGVLGAVGGVLSSAPTGRPGRGGRSPLSRYALVRAVEDYADGRPAGAVTIAALCDRFDVSPSTLHRAFTAWTGLSPTRYLAVRRLHAFRRRLRAEARSRGAVTRAAIGAGFEHLSRASADYRRHFGETPLETFRARGERPRLRDRP